MFAMLSFASFLAVLVVAPIALLILRTPLSGRKLLANWGVTDATEDDRALAHAYLKRRRLLILTALAVTVALFVATGSKVDGVGPYLLWVILPASLALFASELVLVGRKPDGPTRRASLTPRSRRDYVPRWANWTLLGYAVSSLPAIKFMSPFHESVELHLDFWIALGILLGLGAIAESTIRIAVARRPVVESPADTAMRVRSARSMAGFQIGITGFMFLITWAGLGFAMLFFGENPVIGWTLFSLGPIGFAGALTAWGLLASPPRQARPALTPEPT
ncbi:hypothetical protein [Allokutzneria oryzae]|uniref:DUF1648 domain-containing protein n=1 Tax=Allokutzneria oryzae TaxID=1378989 RepID=A0ABV5ZUI2_9PSEU